MTEVDVSRIVPSMRDLHAAVATRRRGLALLPLVDGDDLADEMARLDELEVRAIALRDPGETLRDAARSTKDRPALSLAPAQSAEDCQRARFFGADGLCIQASDEASYKDLSKSAASMRMMPLALAGDAGEVERAAAWGARAILLRASDAQAALAATDRAPGAMVIVAALAEAEPAGLRRLVGHVDAAVVPAAVHRSEIFESLLDELDS